MLYKTFFKGKWLIGLYDKEKNLFTDFDKENIYYKPKKEEVNEIDCCENCPRVFDKYIPTCGYPTVYGKKNLELMQHCPHYKTKRFKQIREERFKEAAIKIGKRYYDR